MGENGTAVMEVDGEESRQNGVKRRRTESPSLEPVFSTLSMLTPPPDNRHGVALRTLDIQGFRSFGPLAADVGHIDWMTPVTLILGPNGTGKTTIIECLKFVTTGETPPNSNRGTAFIHDPKLSNAKEVRGQISLKFVGADNNEYILTRTAQGTTAKNARGQTEVRFKTLESSLSSYDGDNKVTVSHTVDQAGQTMLAVLGVSKPILNSVIFCHQEESDWPLDHGSKLKEKFDEIFSATKYIKALEAFRELKKNDKAELKAAEVLRDQKRLIRNDADAKQLELQAFRSDALALATSLEELQRSFTDLKAAHDTLQTRVEKVTKLEKEGDKLSTKINTLITSISDLEKRLGDEFSGTMEELERELLDSKNIELAKRLAMTTEKKKTTEIEKKLVEVRKSLSKMGQTLGALKAETELNVKTLGERDAKVKELATTYGLKMYVDIVTYLPDEIESFENDYGKLVTEEEDKLEQRKKDITNELDELTKRVIEKKQEQDTLAKTITKTRKEIREKTQKDEDITEQLADMQSQSARLATLEAKIESQTGLLGEAEAKIDIMQVKAKITEDSQLRTTLTDRLKPLKSAVHQKEKQQSLHTQIELLQGQLNEKREAAERQRNKLQAFVDKVGPNLRNEEIKSTFDSKLREATRTCDQMKKAIGRLETEVAVKERDKGTVKNDLDVANNKIKDFEDEFEKLAGVEKSIDAALGLLDEEMKKWQHELAEWEGKSEVIKSLKASFLRQHHQGRPCCPTCHRSFTDESQVQELADELDSILRDVPVQAAVRQAKLTECVSRRDKLIAFQPEIKKIEKVRKSMHDFEEKQKKLNSDIANLLKTKSEHETTLEEAMASHQLCTSSQPDVLKLDSALAELKKNERELNALTNQLDHSGDPRTLEELKTEKEATETELEKLTKSLDETRDTLSKQESVLNKLKDELNNSREQRMKITERLQEKLTLERRATELKEEIEKAKTELEEMVQKEIPLKELIATLGTHKAQTRTRLNAELNENEKAVVVLKDGQKDVQKLAARLKEFERKGVAEKLQSTQTDMDSLTEEIKNKEAEIAQRVEELRKMENDLLGAKTRDQTLKDNKSLRERREELKSLQATFSGTDEQLKSEEPAVLRAEFKDVVSKKNVCAEQLHKQQGRQAELDRSIRGKEKELDVEHIKNARKLYAEAVVKCQVIDLAMKDVEKFYKALDFGVMKFHSNKMEEINRIMRDLWQSTYQGNDIDYIEIRSDADETGIEGDKARRTYNYRVVMVNGDTALDMRGRCSAGQRVLACLIIRLALAEAFAMKCGILALDEPTTNLDRDNIIHLAKALAALIRSRQYAQQKHRFQLIIITHDRDFLDTLNIADEGILVDRYYKIFKDRSGVSRLSNLPYAEM